jgi:indoleamine 2,3-dioxygenase
MPTFGNPVVLPKYILSYLYLSYANFDQRLPPAISVPFLTVAAHLGLPPTATYAGLNLWNYTTVNLSVSISNVDNLRALHTFTGTRDEEWFYLISAAIESHGSRIIPVMLNAMDVADPFARASSSPSTVISALAQFKTCINQVGAILKRMDENCNPDVFYNRIRPFLAGSKNMAVAGLPNGVFYDEGDGQGQFREYSGGSNAQSSLIQFFDVCLGVEHSLTGAKKGSKPGFLKEMRTYMPGPHRAFLEYVESFSNIRTYASTNAEVQVAYNAAVEELSRFRDIHIQIVTRYIINPSKKRGVAKNAGMNLAVASTNGSTKSLHGTGGTALLPFLKQSRDETRETALR